MNLCCYDQNNMERVNADTEAIWRARWPDIAALLRCKVCGRRYYEVSDEPDR